MNKVDALKQLKEIVEHEDCITVLNCQNCYIEEYSKKTRKLFQCYNPKDALCTAKLILRKEFSFFNMLEELLS